MLYIVDIVFIYIKELENLCKSSSHENSGLHSKMSSMIASGIVPSYLAAKYKHALSKGSYCRAYCIAGGSRSLAIIINHNVKVS